MVSFTLRIRDPLLSVESVSTRMIIPISELRADTLTAIIEQHVLTEGTDYGMREFSLDDKVAQVRRQLETGEAYVVYSELHETVNIVPADAVANK